MVKVRISHLLFLILFTQAFTMGTKVSGNSLIIKKDKDPNILIIVLDAVRFDFTSLYSDNIKNTPFLEYLYKNDKIFNFTTTYSTSDDSNSSHYSLMTGFATGIQSAWDFPQISLAYQLKTLGYKTFEISANPNLSHAIMASFIAFDKYTNLIEVWQSMSKEKKDQILYLLDKRILTYSSEINDWNRFMVFCSGAKVFTIFKEYIKSEKQPFFGFINLFDAHDPYFPNENYYNLNRDEASLNQKVDGDLRTRLLSQKQINPDSIKNEKIELDVKERLKIASGRGWSLSDDLSEEAIKIYKNRYAAEVRELDGYVRQIFEYLEKKDLLKSTIIFITSDHGESFGEKGFMTHSLGNKGDYESTHRIPLAIYLPPKYRLKGKRVSELSSIADIAPTIYDLLKVNWIPLSNMNSFRNYGKSLLPFIFGSSNYQYDRVIKIDKNVSEDINKIKKRKKEALKMLKTLGYI